MADMINPSHYKLQLPDGNEIETIEYIEAVLGVDGVVDYCRGSAIKYLSRAGRKSPDTLSEDFRKAAWFCSKASQILVREANDDLDYEIDLLRSKIERRDLGGNNFE